MRSLADDIPLTQRIYDELRDALVRGELEAGKLYSVVEISRQLGVSRTPVREALLKFASEGVVSFERSKGVRILEASVTDVHDLFGLRLLLEVPSAALAAVSENSEQLDRMRQAFSAMEDACARGNELAFQQHDTTFHDAILRAAGNAQVAEAVSRARGQAHTRRLSTTHTRSLAEVIAAHREIHDAVLSGDEARASAAVKAHLTETRDILIAQISKP
ncbi:GntR family transcriptional regulator [Saccharopolyspora spinosa]|uniref:DNA-binding GntR family transcriptional regulator n=1 Tax=Saccharopolyspora spinosa TaxID=60894 RepID=A0A2N3XZL6_SACSN|nr:GntR family transcriptional regulator [Saccharopolyspora spinosa]PKW16113.1 DNA-binding GntR family transcriptional regulator [Saccharopolyspora spinosa]